MQKTLLALAIVLVAHASAVHAAVPVIAAVAKGGAGLLGAGAAKGAGAGAAAGKGAATTKGAGAAGKGVSGKDAAGAKGDEKPGALDKLKKVKDALPNADAAHQKILGVVKDYQGMVANKNPIDTAKQLVEIEQIRKTLGELPAAKRQEFLAAKAADLGTRLNEIQQLMALGASKGIDEPAPQPPEPRPDTASRLFPHRDLPPVLLPTPGEKK